jgi:putative tryptophan/tyrosine transport system substrate-binding protein
MITTVGRREFTMLLGGAAVLWPLAARAQQPEPMRRIGVLMSTTETEPEEKSIVAAFVSTLASAGWTPGRNVTIDYRWEPVIHTSRGNMRASWRRWRPT